MTVDRTNSGTIVRVNENKVWFERLIVSLKSKSWRQYNFALRRLDGSPLAGLSAKLAQPAQAAWVFDKLER